MTFKDIVNTRRSVRQYDPQMIEPEKLDYIIECARRAPSAANRQPWLFIIVKSPEMKQKLQQCYIKEWFASAPLYILACGDVSQSWKRNAFDNKDHCDIDMAIAIEHICLASAELGLGTCWVCNFDIKLCKTLFELPEQMYPVAIIPLGYPAVGEQTPTSRKAKEDICREV